MGVVGEAARELHQALADAAGLVIIPAPCIDNGLGEEGPMLRRCSKRVRTENTQATAKAWRS